MEIIAPGVAKLTFFFVFGGKRKFLRRNGTKLIYEMPDNDVSVTTTKATKFGMTPLNDMYL